MRKSLLALAFFAPLAFGQTQTFTYSYSGLPLAVYPDDWNTVTGLSVLVPKSISITKVTASVTVQYSGVGDLNVYLWSAAGTRTKLLERNCGGLQNIDTTFDDSAPNTYNEFCPAEAGRGPFRGNEPLANSARENAFGYWRLGVENNGSSKTGLVTGFSITITGTVLGPPAIGPNTIVSTSSLESGAVSPGDQVSLIGVNLGPSVGIRADATQNLPTSLGQTSVTFDGIAAPLYYVSNNLVAVQVPVNLSPGSTTHIQVKAASGSSAVVTLPVVSAQPGIFTYEAGGRGQAKATNQDGSLNGDGSINGSDKPTARGSTIQVLATGLGPLNPVIPQGTPAPGDQSSSTVLPVSATIGGRQATVGYAGAAPGKVGVYQVRLTVPFLVPSGPARLTLSVDGNSSQSGVTVQIQ